MSRNPLRNNIGSISSGTMRPEDLVPSFISELLNQRPLHREHRKLIREIEDRQTLYGNHYWVSEESPTAADDLEALFDALEAYTMPYFYFGAHPGDGADYGYWLSDDFQDDFYGLKVSDTSEVPKGHTGEVLHVNDHGNMTLYRYSRGRSREIWALV